MSEPSTLAPPERLLAPSHVLRARLEQLESEADKVRKLLRLALRWEEEEADRAAAQG